MALNCLHYVCGAEDIREHGLVGIILATWNLLQGGGIYDDIGTCERPCNAIDVPNVADNEFHPTFMILKADALRVGQTIGKRESELVLLGLIPGKHNYPRRPAHLCVSSQQSTH